MIVYSDVLSTSTLITCVCALQSGVEISKTQSILFSWGFSFQLVSPQHKSTVLFCLQIFLGIRDSLISTQKKHRKYITLSPRPHTCKFVDLAPLRRSLKHLFMKGSHESIHQAPGLFPSLRPYLDPISMLLGANFFSWVFYKIKLDPFWESNKQQIVCTSFKSFTFYNL